MMLDYEPIYSNAEVAKMNDVVFTGVVAGAQQGPEFGNFSDEMTDMSTVVLEVHPTRVVSGELNSSKPAYLVLRTRRSGPQGVAIRSAHWSSCGNLCNEVAGARKGGSKH